MIFQDIPLPGACLIDIEPKADDRGFFARFFCDEEFAGKGLDSRFVQANNSFSVRAGTLRGMHFQAAPAEEVKLVRCIRGSLWDCIVDVRPHSPTYLEWYGAILSAQNRRMMYVPKGFAHGFITLADNTEALYLVTAPYSPAHERGLRWDDPALAIEWPRAPVELSSKDGRWPLLGDAGAPASFR